MLTSFRQVQVMSYMGEARSTADQEEESSIYQTGISSIVSIHINKVIARNSQ